MAVNNSLCDKGSCVRPEDKESLRSQHTGDAQQPKLLIAATVRWPTAARLALSLKRAGFAVDAVYPPEHPLGSTRAVQQSYSYSAIDPLGSLTRAMLASTPHLIIPCDDRVVGHIHSIYDRAPETANDSGGLRSLIERSLGDPTGYPTTMSRAAILEIAQQEQVPVPASHPITSIGDLRGQCDRICLPWVLKVDGTWGGGGIQVVHSIEEAELALRRMALNQGFKRLNHLIIHRDRFLLRDLLRSPMPKVTVQEFIHGRPATSLVACWKGEVLAQINAEVLCAQGDTGASTIVRLIDNPDMNIAAERLVRRLGLSGFGGFDFMLETLSGRCLLIEMNPRNTQLGHFNLGQGRDFAAALFAQITDTQVRQHQVTTDSNIIAFFPQAERFHPSSNHFRSAFLDIPYEDPALLRELTRTPYNARGFMARIFNALLGRMRDSTLPPGLSQKIVHEQKMM